MVLHWLNKGGKYTMQSREIARNNWLKHIISNNEFTLMPLAEDCSFRRYFRLQSGDISRVLMDAPPEKEALLPFIYIARMLAKHGIHTPEIFKLDEIQGFALIEDLGDTLFFNARLTDKTDTLYTSAINTLCQMQTIDANTSTLPVFDTAFMMGELQLFHDWFLQAYLSISITKNDEALLNKTFDWLTAEIETQPRVFMHRDYHSRNLMVTNKGLGVIDFQDACQGPITYDLVSLLKDCYIQLPHDKLLYELRYFHKNMPAPYQAAFSESTLIRAFDLCGLQRHLKVLGIFSRMHLRDNKSRYLQDLPLTYDYVMACLETYKELQPFYEFMQRVVQPVFLKVNRS
jgi:hypothetical protein